MAEEAGAGPNLEHPSASGDFRRDKLVPLFVNSAYNLIGFAWLIQKFVLAVVMVFVETKRRFPITSMVRRSLRGTHAVVRAYPCFSILCRRPLISLPFILLTITVLQRGAFCSVLGIGSA